MLPAACSYREYKLSKPIDPVFNYAKTENETKAIKRYTRQKKTLKDQHSNSTGESNESTKKWRSGSSEGRRRGGVDSCNLGDHQSSFPPTFFILVLALKDRCLESSTVMNRKLNERPLCSEQPPPHTEKPCERLERTMNGCGRGKCVARHRQEQYVNSQGTQRNGYTTLPYKRARRPKAQEKIGTDMSLTFLWDH